MKKNTLKLFVCIFMATLFAFPTYAADYTLAPTQNQNSVPDYLHLYYESGPLTIYAGEIVELDNDSEMRAAYHTRHFDYPFEVYFNKIHIATLTAHLTTMGLDRDWCFADSGSYTYTTHVGMVNVLYWELNTTSNTFIQAAVKILYINNEIGPSAFRFYANTENGDVSI